MDGFTYAAAASLGFASIENAEYVLNAHYHAASALYAWSDAVHTIGARTFLSVPGHVLFSIDFLHTGDVGSIPEMVAGGTFALTVHERSIERIWKTEEGFRIGRLPRLTRMLLINTD